MATALEAQALDYLHSEKETLLAVLVEGLDAQYRIKGQKSYRLLVKTDHIKDRKNLIARHDAESDNKKKQAIGNEMRKELLILKGK